MSATGSVLGVCLALAAAVPPGAESRPPADAAFVPQRAFTLAWTHSIEKTRWEEDYRVARAADGSPLLRLVRARIRVLLHGNRLLRFKQIQGLPWVRQGKNPCNGILRTVSYRLTLGYNSVAPPRSALCCSAHISA